MSPANRPHPLTSGGSSSRSTDCPIHFGAVVIAQGRQRSCPRAQRGAKTPAEQGKRIWVVIPAKRARSKRARASRDPVIHGRSECTKGIDYWIPALARRAQPGLLGRNDAHECV